MTMASTSVTSTRSILIASGTVAVIMGILLLAWPEATVTVVAILLGIDLLLVGVGILFATLATETSVGEKVLGVVFGVLALLAGVVVLARPLHSVSILVVIAGAFWVVGGVIDIVTALFGSGIGSRWLLALSGVISVAFGIVLISWPEPTLRVIIWLIGLWSLVAGLVWLFRGFRTPKAALV